MVRRLVTGSLLGLICLACTSAVAQQRSDQLFPVRGTPVSGLVTEVSPTEVVVNVRGSDQKFSVLDVKRISFGEEPRELTTARDNVLSGQLESGLDQLKRIDVAVLQRDLVKQDWEFYIAYAQAKLALTGGGDKEAASTGLMNFARSAPRSFHFCEAAELLGDLAVAREKYDEAGRFYSFLTKTAQEASWPEYGMRVEVLEARVFEVQGNHAEAIQKYDGVINATIDSAEANRQKSLAQVGKAVVLAEMGKPDEGAKIIEEIIQKNDPQDSELFGRAYNAQGRCYLKQQKPKEALLAYLHVDVLFYQQPEIHAEALYHLSKLWVNANKSDRAVAARSLLTERYAGSAWAKRN